MNKKKWRRVYVKINHTDRKKYKIKSKNNDDIIQQQKNKLNKTQTNDEREKERKK